MNGENNNFERIELYTKGKMTLEEKSAFEDEMSRDKELQAQVEIAEVINQIIIGDEALKIKEKIRKDLNLPKTRSRGYIIPLLLLLGTMITASILYFSKTEKKKAVAILKQSSPVQQKVENSAELKTQPAIENTARNTKLKTSSTIPIPVKESLAAPLAAVPQTHISIFDTISNSTTSQKILEIIKTEKISEVDTCNYLHNTVDYFTVPSCKDDETGEVHIKPETVKGGTPPFTFSLNEKASKVHFDRIPAGSYSLTIHDAKNCSVEINKKVVVAEISCNKNSQHVFNPEYDGTWSIPFHKNKTPIHLTIVDKSGKVFYQTSVKDAQPAEWNGSSNTGMSLEVALYFYRIQYEDNSFENGSILISR